MLKAGDKIMQAIKEQDWQMLPELAQQEIYDFFIRIKQQYEQQGDESVPIVIKAQSNSSKITRLNALKVESFIPLSRDEIYAR